MNKTLNNAYFAPDSIKIRKVVELGLQEFLNMINTYFRAAELHPVWNVETGCKYKFSKHVKTILDSGHFNHCIPNSMTRIAIRITI